MTHLNSRRSSLGQFVAIASISWSTWMLTDNLSPVPITRIFADDKIGRIAIQSWSVMCAIPLNTQDCNWLPCRVMNLFKISSDKLSDESKSKAVNDRQVPDSIHAFMTESLKPFIWPALKNFKPGMRVSMSIRHSLERSVAEMSSSWIMLKEIWWNLIESRDVSLTHVLSHSTLITCSDCKLVPFINKHFNRLDLWNSVFNVAPVTLLQ